MAKRSTKNSKRIAAVAQTIPSRSEFNKGCAAFRAHVKHDPIYPVATFYAAHFLGKPAQMADAVATLLMTWNKGFYRFGPLDLDRLNTCIRNNLARLERFRGRDILSFSPGDRDVVGMLFREFMVALRVVSKKGEVKRGIVSAARALHVLAPNFFPLWDYKIALGYRCAYNKEPEESYIQFCQRVKRVAEVVRGYEGQHDRGILKLIDEYNYAKYTKEWI